MRKIISILLGLTFTSASFGSSITEPETEKINQLIEKSSLALLEYYNSNSLEALDQIPDEELEEYCLEFRESSSHRSFEIAGAVIENWHIGVGVGVGAAVFAAVTTGLNSWSKSLKEAAIIKESKKINDKWNMIIKSEIALAREIGRINDRMTEKQIDAQMVRIMLPSQKAKIIEIDEFTKLRRSQWF